MAFRDWSPDDYDGFYEAAFQNIFNEIPSVPYLGDEQLERAEALFEAGWLTFGEYSKEQLDVIRDEFYDQMSMQESQFDWEEYRDLYAETG
jgi:hypothetical protein